MFASAFPSSSRGKIDDIIRFCGCNTKAASNIRLTQFQNCSRFKMRSMLGVTYFEGDFILAFRLPEGMDGWIASQNQLLGKL